MPREAHKMTKYTLFYSLTNNGEQLQPLVLFDLACDEEIDIAQFFLDCSQVFSETPVFSGAVAI